MKTKIARKTKEKPSYDGRAVHDFAEDLGMNIVSYRDASENGWSHIRDMLGYDGKSLIIFRPADRDYDFDGYEPWHDGMSGGRYPDITSALNWLKRAKDIRSGAAHSFLGV